MKDIKYYIKQCFGNAVYKGFFTCPKCKGLNKFCKTCNGKENYVDIEDLLMHTTGEFSEVREAFRLGKKADYYCYNIMGPNSFKTYIKDTPEEELADSFIILFSLCGYLNVSFHFVELCNKLFAVRFKKEFDKNACIGALLNRITYNLQYAYYNGNFVNGIYTAFDLLLQACNSLKIDIIPYIEAKMLYNLNRPKYNGKEF